MKFTLYWRGGDKEVVTGKTIADAMNNRGYGHGALAALDFYMPGEDDDYTWSKETRQWIRKEKDGYVPRQTVSQ
jgi:hypothetical protein